MNAVNTEIDRVTHRTPTNLPLSHLVSQFANNDPIVYNRYGLEGGGRRLRNAVELEQERGAKRRTVENPLLMTTNTKVEVKMKVMKVRVRTEIITFNGSSTLKQYLDKSK